MVDKFIPQNHHLASRAIAMPRDANPDGDIFGGWLVSQMDLAAGTVASLKANGRVVTVAIDGFTFHKPVFIGDEVSCYAELIKIGRTSMTIRVEAWVRRRRSNETLKVTEGVFTFVALDDNHKPRSIEDHQ